MVAKYPTNRNVDSKVIVSEGGRDYIIIFVKLQIITVYVIVSNVKNNLADKLSKIWFHVTSYPLGHCPDHF